MSRIKYKILQATESMEMQVLLGECSERDARLRFREHLDAYPNRVQLLVRVNESYPFDSAPLIEVIGEGGSYEK